MKKTILTFGLVSGAILSVMMLVTLPFMDRIGFGRAEVIGYTSIVAASLMIFFGIRSYRDRDAEGSLSFGQAFKVGILISILSSVCYVVTWQVIYYQLAPDFVEKYSAYSLEKARAKGATPQELEAKRAEMQEFQEMYRNPFINAAITFVEPFSIELIMSLVSAGILRRRRRVGYNGSQPERAFSSGSKGS
jgi:hypothetical protein